MRRRRDAWLFAGVLLALGTGCTRKPAPAAKSAGFSGAPVIIVSIDTLRADHLPSYGYTAVATPAIDALARDAILFENAYAAAPLTFPSHVSLLTGLNPPAHGVRNNLGYHFDAGRHATLQKLLKGFGYATGGAISAYVLNAGTGIADSMDFFDDRVGNPTEGAEAAGAVQRPGMATMRRALDWVRGVKAQPFFLFLHVYEPHFPYLPPEPFRGRYGATYDGEIAASDAIVGEFIAALRSEGIYDRALLFLVSDHGEGLGDHGEEEHGILLHREMLHVPLLLKLPGAAQGATRVKRPVALVDIVPTTARLLGFEAADVAGQPLTGADGTPAAAQARGIYGETYYPRIAFGWSDLRSLIDDQYHWIEAPRPELYDIVRDPAEKDNLAATRASVAEAMRRTLRGYADSFSAPSSIDPEAAERLKALGYLAGGTGSAPEPAAGAALPNPQDKIPDYEEMRGAFRLAREGRHEPAVAAFRRVLAKNPASFDAQWELAAILNRQGKLDQAATEYQKAMRLSPSMAGLVALSLGDLELKRGRPAEAEANARAAMKLDPVRANQLLARTLIARRDIPAALAALDSAQQALQARRGAPVPGLSYQRADVLARLGRYAEAEKAFGEEIAAFPANTQAYASLAVLMGIQGRSPQEISALLERMTTVSPGRETMDLAAKTLRFMGDNEGAAAWSRRAEAAGPAKPPR